MIKDLQETWALGGGFGLVLEGLLHGFSVKVIELILGSGPGGQVSELTR